MALPLQGGCQALVVLPGGNLYVPGAEKLLPNIKRLTDAARHGKVFLVSHGDFHPPNDPEFKIFPPHCVKGTRGAELVPEATTDRVARVPNDPDAKLPEDLSEYEQILLEKQTLSIFETRHVDELVRRLGGRAEFVVFGVVTEYCVSFAVKGLLERGRRVAVSAGCDRNPEAGRRGKNRRRIPKTWSETYNYRPGSRGAQPLRAWFKSKRV